ncbi:MAG: rRNA maturation RNase YbeY [Candidatus Marinimicrobia bacterium]|nr:rRNA maturation RNase YbeY [Candidatus Neomarinimicrobiota bacterium]
MITPNIINDYNEKLLFDISLVNQLVNSVFLGEGQSKAELNIILTNRETLSSLKKQYFNVDQFTDVIAFNLEDKDEDIEGEVYISIDDVLENSKTFSVTFNNEFKRVLIHGVLHLLGYDDHEEDDIKIMRDLEQKYLLNSNNNIISLK